MCGPIRLGWGNFGPSSLRTAFLKTTIPLNVNSTAFEMYLTPARYYGASSYSTNGFFTYADFASGGSTLASGLGLTTFNLSSYNATSLATVVEAARVVSASLRVVARYAATAARGTISGVYLTDATGSEMFSTNPNTLVGLNSARWAASDAAGNVGVEVLYKPSDPSSFIFDSSIGVITTSGALPRLVVAGNGWPTGGGVVFEIQAIVHYETLSGLDAAGDDDIGMAPSLSSSGVSMDHAAAELSTLQPVNPSISSIEMIDHALRQAALSGSRTGMGSLGSRLGASSSSSSSSSRGAPLIEDVGDQGNRGFMSDTLTVPNGTIPLRTDYVSVRR